MNRRIFRRVPARKRGLIAALVAAVAASLAVAGWAGAASAAPAAPAVKPPGASTGLGQLDGLLPRDQLTLESAIQVNLSNETARLPLYPGIAYKGTPQEEKVWYVLMDSSDAGAAHDLGVNYAPKLANIAISCSACVQTVTLENPTPQQNPFGPATIDFAGAPDFSPTRIAIPGPDGFPLAASARPSSRSPSRGSPVLSGDVTYSPDPLEPPADGEVLVSCAQSGTVIDLDM